MIYIRLERDVVTEITEEYRPEENNDEVRWESLRNLIGKNPTVRDVEKIQVGYTYHQRKRIFTPPGMA